MKILNFGSLNVDRVYSVHDFVRAGETILAKELHFFPGGKGLNQTVAVAKAGGKIYHAGIIGRDGGILKECLTENGVSLDFLKEMPDADGGHTALQVSDSGQNAIIVYPGTNAMISRDWIDEVMRQVEPGDMVLMQNEISNVPYVIQRAREAGAVVVLNPSPITENLKTYPIASCNMLIVNEIEGGALTGETEPERILDQMRLQYPHTVCVLTLGKGGSWYVDGTRRIYQPIFRAQAVDTTAAGDTFCGYLLAGLSQHMTPEAAMEMASAAAAIAVTVKGAATSIPAKEVVEEFLAGRRTD